MSDLENAVARHYGDNGLLTRIFSGLEAVGTDINNLGPDDLAPVEEFHIGGRKATAHAVAQLPLNSDHHVLDVGCGIGGTARYLTGQTGCRVTGIDLTPEYVEVAQKLTELTGQSDKISFQVASALDMPLADASFDGAITIHVAMNIPDRTGLYREIARVLKPGAVFCLYDIMKKGQEDLVFPVPWAQSAQTSHLTTPEDMRTLLDDAGFEVLDMEDRTDFALEYFEQTRAAAKDGPSPLGPHIVMGASAPEKVRNIRENIGTGRVAPVQMIATRRSTPL